MATANAIKSTHKNYTATADSLLLVRDAVKGNDAIKSSVNTERLYLPDPRTANQPKNQPKTTLEVDQYNNYLAAAEFDEFPGSTLGAWVGLMDMEKATFVVPDKSAHLIDNANGDGTPLSEMIEITASNVFQTKYHGLLVEYGGHFGDKSSETMTAAQAKSLGIQSSIKSYPRESIVDWDYSIVNGVNKLSYLKLKEIYDDRSEDGFTVEQKVNYLVLRLDSEGMYYQEKYFCVDAMDVEPDYYEPKANGSRLDYIPFVFAFDQRIQTNSLPKEMGAISPICLKAVSRLRTSASLMRALDLLVPTLFTMGWAQGDFEIFKEANGGRVNITSGPGSINNLPNNVKIEVVEMSDSSALFKQMDRNQQEAVALGARFDFEQAANETATQVRARTAKETALLVNAANGLEEAFTLALEIAATFDGVADPEVEVSLDKDFSNSKLGVEERKMLLDEFLANVHTRDQYEEILINGGVKTAMVDGDIMGE